MFPNIIFFNPAWEDLVAEWGVLLIMVARLTTGMSIDIFSRPLNTGYGHCASRDLLAKTFHYSVKPHTARVQYILHYLAHSTLHNVILCTGRQRAGSLSATGSNIFTLCTVGESSVARIVPAAGGAVKGGEGLFSWHQLFAQHSNTSGSCAQSYPSSSTYF